MPKELNKNFQKVIRANLRHSWTKNYPLIPRINTNKKRTIKIGN